MQGMGDVNFKTHTDALSSATKTSAKASGRESSNIEDQLRVANELLRGLEILGQSDNEKEKEADELREELTDLIGEFAKAILEGERSIASSDHEKRSVAFNYLVSFLMSFASRTGTRDRLHVFTTNYDRIIEAGADVAGLHLIDRFVGTIAPIFRSSRLDVDMHYNPPGIRGEPRYLEGVAKYTKLHGSLDWVSNGRTIHRMGLPFGAPSIQPYLEAPGLDQGDALKLMIYPNASKDQETSLYPYVELFRDFAAAACRPNNTLLTFGYSFGDEHINRVIEDMLTIPSAHLVVIAHGDPLGRVMETYERMGRHAQVSLLLGNHLGDLQKLVDHYLPKPAIDRTTIRMADLLKSRWSTSTDDVGSDGDNSSANAGGAAS
ncbi:SIR2 family protein [Rhodopirellula sp. JC740]|uniref:SIR2 family protein n=1 Tax=Rhodopirellula halodulae TaxID=2894198 RepID=A0ABS8NQJ7_9BACT|nr:SIR2 family protein [Rhodopirellula sp. JC740]MCC9645103.1 SIR2 family protein [Rhodopirellula sp. JC740]